MSINKSSLAVALIAALSGCGDSDNDNNGDNSPTPTKATTLTQSWQSIDNSLSTPESVLHDSVNRVIYVANVNRSVPGSPWIDNNGYISTLDENGSILEEQWATGLKAPKGMAINDYRLYAADLNTVAVIDTITGEVLETLTAPDGADHLNDLIYDPSSATLYVSDSDDDVIYQIDSSGKFSVFYEAEVNLPYQGGLYLDGENIIMVGSEGSIKSINTSDRTVSIIAEDINRQIDGIWKYNSTGFFVSGFQGAIYFVGYDGVVSELLITEPSRTADISYSSELNLLLVPDFNDKVIAYTVD